MVEIESGIKTMTIDTMGTSSVVSEATISQTNSLFVTFIPRHFYVGNFFFVEIKFLVFLEHDDRGENVGKPIHRNKNTRRVSFKPSGAGPGGRQFNNKPQKNLNLAIRATLDDDDDMVDFPNGLNRDGNVSVAFECVFFFRR